MFSRARAGRGHMATRWVGGPFFVYCCKTGELNTAICSGSSEVVLCSRQQALERCKSKYSVVCSSLNTPVWPAGRRFVIIARNLAGWRRGPRWPWRKHAPRSGMMSLSSVTPRPAETGSRATRCGWTCSSRARGRASRLTEIAVCTAPEAAEEALATTDACGEGA